MNGSRIRQGVHVHRPAGVADLVEIDIPFWLDFLDWLVGHPGGEAFVQPDIVPPFHGH
jgi:hypothetical protein